MRIDYNPNGSRKLYTKNYLGEEYSVTYGSNGQVASETPPGSLYKTHAMMNLNTGGRLGGFTEIGKFWLLEGMDSNTPDHLINTPLFKETRNVIENAKNLTTLDPSEFDSLIDASQWKPQILHGGWNGHAVSYVMYDGNMHMINRGSKALNFWDLAEITSWRAPSPKQMSAVITRLKEANSMDKAEAWDHISGITSDIEGVRFLPSTTRTANFVSTLASKLQGTGNCFLTSLQGASKLSMAFIQKELLEVRGLNPSPSRVLIEMNEVYDNTISMESMRRSVLQDYLPRRMEEDRHYNPFEDSDLFHNLDRENLSWRQKNRFVTIYDLIEENSGSWPVTTDTVPSWVGDVVREHRVDQEAHRQDKLKYDDAFDGPMADDHTVGTADAHAGGGVHVNGGSGQYAPSRIIDDSIDEKSTVSGVAEPSAVPSFAQRVYARVAADPNYNPFFDEKEVGDLNYDNGIFRIPTAEQLEKWSFMLDELSAHGDIEIKMSSLERTNILGEIVDYRMINQPSNQQASHSNGSGSYQDQQTYKQVLSQIDGIATVVYEVVSDNVADKKPDPPSLPKSEPGSAQNDPSGAEDSGAVSTVPSDTQVLNSDSAKADDSEALLRETLISRAESVDDSSLAERETLMDRELVDVVRTDTREENGVTNVYFIDAEDMAIAQDTLNSEGQVIERRLNDPNNDDYLTVKIETYGYDADGGRRVTGWTDFENIDGQRMRIDYREDGSISSITGYHDDEIKKLTLFFNKESMVITESHFDEFGDPTKSIDFAPYHPDLASEERGVKIETGYGRLGQPSYKIYYDRDGVPKTKDGLDDRQRVVSTTTFDEQKYMSPLRTEWYAYDADGEKRLERELFFEDGKEDYDRVYDENSAIVETSRWRYREDGSLAQKTTRSGESQLKITRTYNENSVLVSEEVPLDIGGSRKIWFRDNGTIERIAKISAGNRLEYSMYFDEATNLTSERAFDEKGRLTEFIDNIKKYKETFQYSWSGRLESSTLEFGGDVYEFGYDKNGRIISEKLIHGEGLLKLDVIMNMDKSYPGLDRKIGLFWVSQGLDGFKTDDPTLKGVYQDMTSAMNNAHVAGSLNEKSMKSIIEKSEQSPQFITGGWDAHAVGFVVFKGHIYVANKGDSVHHDHDANGRMQAITAYKVDDGGMLDCLRAIKSAVTQNKGDANTTLSQAPWKDVTEETMFKQFNRVAQRLGNCSYASVQTGLRAIAWLSAEDRMGPNTTADEVEKMVEGTIRLDESGIPILDENGLRQYDGGLYHQTIGGENRRRVEFSKYLDARLAINPSYDPYTDENLLGEMKVDEKGEPIALSRGQKNRLVMIHDIVALKKGAGVETPSWVKPIVDTHLESKYALPSSDSKSSDVQQQSKPVDSTEPANSAKPDLGSNNGLSQEQQTGTESAPKSASPGAPQSAPKAPESGVANPAGDSAAASSDVATQTAESVSDSEVEEVLAYAEAASSADEASGADSEASVERIPTMHTTTGGIELPINEKTGQLYDSYYVTEDRDIFGFEGDTDDETVFTDDFISENGEHLGTAPGEAPEKEVIKINESGFAVWRGADMVDGLPTYHPLIAGIYAKGNNTIAFYGGPDGLQDGVYSKQYSETVVKEGDTYEKGGVTYTVMKVHEGERETENGTVKTTVFAGVHFDAHTETGIVDDSFQVEASVSFGATSQLTVRGALSTEAGDHAGTGIKGNPNAQGGTNFGSADVVAGVGGQGFLNVKVGEDFALNAQGTLQFGVSGQVTGQAQVGSLGVLASAGATVGGFGIGAEVNFRVEDGKVTVGFGGQLAFIFGVEWSVEFTIDFKQMHQNIQEATKVGTNWLVQGLFMGGIFGTDHATLDENNRYFSEEWGRSLVVVNQLGNDSNGDPLAYYINAGTRGLATDIDKVVLPGTNLEWEYFDGKREQIPGDMNIPNSAMDHNFIFEHGYRHKETGTIVYMRGEDSVYFDEFVVEEIEIGSSGREHFSWMLGWENAKGYSLGSFTGDAKDAGAFPGLTDTNIEQLFNKFNTNSETGSGKWQVLNKTELRALVDYLYSKAPKETHFETKNSDFKFTLPLTDDETPYYHYYVDHDGALYGKNSANGNFPSENPTDYGWVRLGDKAPEGLPRGRQLHVGSDHQLYVVKNGEWQAYAKPKTHFETKNGDFKITLPLADDETPYVHYYVGDDGTFYGRNEGGGTVPSNGSHDGWKILSGKAPADLPSGVNLHVGQKNHILQIPKEGGGWKEYVPPIDEVPLTEADMPLLSIIHDKASAHSSVSFVERLEMRAPTDGRRLAFGYIIEDMNGSGDYIEDLGFKGAVYSRLNQIFNEFASKGDDSIMRIDAEAFDRFIDKVKSMIESYKNR